MKTIQFNGEYWYEEDRPVWSRVLRWVIWVGGWSTFRKWPLRERLTPDKLTPISLLGHRITIQDWGFNVGRWNVSWKEGYEGGRSWRIYRSANGTPWAADKWVLGAPPQVRHAAQQKATTTDEYFEPQVIR